MAAGLGFGSGFAQGFANAVLQRRQRQQQTADMEQARKDRLFQTMLPIYLENVEDPADLEPLFRQQFPEIFDVKTKGKTPGDGPFDKVKNVLGMVLGHRGAMGMPKTPVAMDGPGTGGFGGNLPHTDPVTGIHIPGRPDRNPSGGLPQPITAQQSGGALPQSVDPASTTPPQMLQDPSLGFDPSGAPPATGEPTTPQRRTLFGIPVLSPDEKAERAGERQALQDNARLRVIARVAQEEVRNGIYPDLQTALMAHGVQTPLARQGVLPQTGTFGDFVLRKQSELGRQLTTQEVSDARTEWESLNDSSGVRIERMAKTLFDKPFAQLTRAERDIVLREDQRALGKEAQSRVEGTATGKMNAPADLETAQKTGVQVGTTAASVAGQNVPTANEKERRRSVEDLKAGLEDIRDNLLDALPGKDELGGLAPGAAFALRRRSPQYREKIARLEAAVNGLVNTVARSVGEQRGAQTEQDAIRAEAGIASLRDAFLTGDTRESASARIDETIRIMDRILTSLPATPVAKPTEPAAEPATTPKADAAPAGGTFSIPYTDPKTGERKIGTFDTQAKLDAFKRAMGLN